ncbi:hypothetical protein C0Q70_06735 [Pomacea canaliculata]|uniref:INO80 complex subunit E N-terminal domain-containing protein n=1 Tax=Pomacea canaliculata TaxID=400727 RepID=A0A2T7PD30_POMCA|nr:INO80 complex subunit E-like isoform X2 [Pomacea canaliculata]PVD31323.1 hypothetical protein C0Q70_06735 [Pomacea canaliculata]
MMPVPDTYSEPQIDYKQKYKALKKRLKLLVYEQECFLEELRKAQRKLLKVARDRSFLLDRLLQYENVDDSSGDSDATASSESDGESQHKDGTPAKRRRVSGHSTNLGQSHGANSADGAQTATSASIASIILAQQQAASSSTVNQEGGKRRAKTSTKRSKTSVKAAAEVAEPPVTSTSSMPRQMTREELERHLDSKQNAFGIEKATASLPMEIFSNDSSNHASDLAGNGGLADDEEDLVIDVPQ